MHVVKKQHDTAIITVDPALARGDKEQIESLKGLCGELQEEGYSRIVLDMAQVEHAPSLILGSIIVLQKRIKAQAGELGIMRPTERLKRIFEITKMNTLIPFYSEQEVGNPSAHTSAPRRADS